MKNRKEFVIIGGILIVFVIIALFGMVYAAYSETLNISGSATAKTASWKIKFDELQDAEKVGEADEVTNPTISTDTKIGDYVVTLSKPGDSISYTFKVKNEGTFDASVTSVTVSKPNCTAVAEDSNAQNFCTKHITYKLYDTTKMPENTEVAIGDELKQDAEKQLKLVLSYDAETPSTELPKNDITISGLDVAIIYGQK